MPRFLVSPADIRGRHFLLRGTEAHHALHVLRKSVGDEIELFDGQDLSYRGRITAVTTSEIHGTLEASAAGPSLPVDLVLCQGLLKGPKWDWFLEKACELGVSRVIPFTSQRTVVRIKTSEVAAKKSRWDRIALAASKQCGRREVMKIDDPSEIHRLWTLPPASARSLVPWEKESQQSISGALKGSNAKEVWLFTGPEGGWDAREIEAAQRAGIVPVRLGPTLLRSETAGLVAATLTFAALGVY